MTKLRDICRFQSGGTPSRGTPAYFNGNVPWITTVALNGDVIDGNQAIEWITDEAIAKSAAKIVPPHSVMVGTRVGIGKVAINSVPMSTSQDIISLIGIDENKWDKKFICHLITANKEHLTSQARGATIKGIKIEAIADLVLPEISLKEQARISEVIGKVDALMHMHQQMAMNLEQLIKSRFIELFGDIVLNPFGWEKDYLGVVCDVRDGTHDSPHYHSTGFPLVTSKNVTGGEIDLTDCSLISEADFNKINERSKVNMGDIIMPMIGTVGKPVIVNVEPNFAIKNVSLIKFKVDSRVLNTFVRSLLQSDYFDDAVLSKVRGGTQKFISLGDIRKLAVIVPPMELQEQFAAFVEQTDKSKYYSSLSFRYCQAAANTYRQEWMTCRTSDF